MDQIKCKLKYHNKIAFIKRKLLYKLKNYYIFTFIKIKLLSKLK